VYVGVSDQKQNQRRGDEQPAGVAAWILRVQDFENGGGRCGTPERIGMETELNCALPSRVDETGDGRWGRGVTAEPGGGNYDGSFTFEGKAARCEFEKDNAKGMDVRSDAGRLAAKLLRRHIGRGSDKDLSGNNRSQITLGLNLAREAEIGDYGAQARTLADEHDIGRLEIAMDNSEFVRLGEAGYDLRGYGICFGDGNAATLETSGEGFAREKFHGDKAWTAGGRHDVIEPANVGVGDQHGDVELVSERRDGLAVAETGGQNSFESNIDISQAIKSAVDLTSAARRDERGDFEAICKEFSAGKDARWSGLVGGCPERSF